MISESQANKRVIARAYRLPAYEFEGRWFNTRTNLIAHPRLIAISQQQDTYTDTKGQVRSVHDNAILSVGDNPGRRGPKGDQLRIAARSVGATVYPKECDVHGMVPHSVLHGKCLSCYNTTGAERKAEAKPVTSERVNARSAGHTTFIGNCPVHGKVPFNVRHGKCLTCYSTTGHTRKRPANWTATDEPTARIQARRDGERTYTANCAIHGAADHCVIRGLCLKCYNTLGVPRPKSSNPVGYYVDRVGVIREAR